MNPSEDSLKDAPETIRIGSPFAIDPFAQPDATSLSPVTDELVCYQSSPLRYTAMGAVVASIMVGLFSIAASVWFPAGGAMTASLGCLLSVIGLYSKLRVLAVFLLLGHLGLFMLNYAQLIE